jgi:hypothetical protein
VTIEHARGSQTVKVNQRQEPAIDKLFQPLGVFEFTGDGPAVVTVGTKDTAGFVVVDAIQFVPASP